MFRYKAISKQEYIDEYKLLCDSHPFYRAMSTELNIDKYPSKIVCEIILNFDIDCSPYLESISKRYNISIPVDITKRNLVLILACNDKIDKTNLLGSIFYSKLYNGEWIEFSQILSAFVDFEGALTLNSKMRNSRFSSIITTKIIDTLIDYGFPSKLFGNYRKTFKYEAIPKEKYVDEFKKLCDADSCCNSLFVQMKDDSKLRIDAIKCFSGLIYVLPHRINITKEQLLLLLLCCDKIDKNDLVKNIIDNYIRGKEFKLCFEENDEQLKFLQIASSFTSFEKTFSYYSKKTINEVIINLVNYGFPLKLFGKYGKMFIDYNFKRMDCIKLSLLNFPLDVLNIVHSFLPVENLTEKSQCCIQ